MAKIIPTTLPVFGPSYEQRLQSALRIHLAGRQSVSMLVEAGRLQRSVHGYEPTNNEAQSCCYDLFDWSASGLGMHLSRSKHIANLYKVGRSDLLTAVNEAWLQGQQKRSMQ